MFSRSRSVDSLEDIKLRNILKEIKGLRANSDVNVSDPAILGNERELQQTETELIEQCILSFNSSYHISTGIPLGATDGVSVESKLSFKNDCAVCPSDVSYNSDSSSSSESCTKSSNKKMVKSLSKISSTMIAIFRIMILDIPLFVLTTLLLATILARRLFVTFWIPILDHVTWTELKMSSRRTYYRKECSASDIFPHSSDQLILDPSISSPQDAVELIMRTGAAVFPSILSTEKMSDLRNFILQQNMALNEENGIPLLSQDFRWSFAIGGDMDPSIPPILYEIASNAFLQSSLDLLFGKDPAIIELTAITSAYGAGNQYWHPDTMFESSYMHYARSFVPYYSLFIPLQDTTSGMGATSVCPSTHLCGDGSNLGYLCDELGFQISDNEEGVWKAGDGFLLHLNVYHRGPAHIDPNGEERVILIMSIAPRPTGPHLETSQLGLGTSYSQRWDMWGLTMRDLLDIRAAMSWPRKILRTFGIYKSWKGIHDSNDVKWGWDYVTVACSRIANNQMGFRYGDLERFVKKMRRSGMVAEVLFGWLPDRKGQNKAEEQMYVQQTNVVETGWREYIHETSRRLVIAAVTLYCAACIFYVAVGTLICKSYLYVFRAARIFAGVFVLYLGFLHHVSNSPWGRDARSLSLAPHPFPKSVRLDGSLRRRLDLPANSIIVSESETSKSKTTLPSKNDVFIATRLDSPKFHAHNTIFDYQPGNMLWRRLIRDSAHIFSSHSELSSSIHGSIIRGIVKNLEMNGGRFLLQDHEGNWVLLSFREAMKITLAEIHSNYNQLKRRMHTEVKYSLSECRHGRLRDTVMSSYYSVLLLQSIEELLFPASFEGWDMSYEPSSRSHNQFQLVRLTCSCIRDNMKMKRVHTVDEDDAYQEFEVEDVIEGSFEEGWFRGKVVDVDELGTYTVMYDDGDIVPSQTPLRSFIPYEEGEVIEAYLSDGTLQGTILSVRADSTLDIFSKDGIVYNSVPIRSIHRTS